MDNHLYVCVCKREIRSVTVSVCALFGPCFPIPDYPKFIFSAAGWLSDIISASDITADNTGRPFSIAI